MTFDYIIQSPTGDRYPAQNIEASPEAYASQLAEGWTLVEVTRRPAAPATTTTAAGCCNGDAMEDDLLMEMPAPSFSLALEDPETGQTTQTRDYATIDRLLDAGFIPMRPDGSPYERYPFMGGVLLDGSPLNVILGQGWISTQKELLVPLIESGQIPTPLLWSSPATISIDALPMTTMAGFGLVGGAVLVGGLWILSRTTRKRKR